MAVYFSIANIISLNQINKFYSNYIDGRYICVSSFGSFKSDIWREHEIIVQQAVADNIEFIYTMCGLKVSAVEGATLLHSSNL